MAANDDGRMNFQARLDNERLRSDAAESQDILRRISRTAEQEGNNIDAAFRRVGATIAGVFTAQKALEFARSIIDVRKEIESMEISFRTLLGSKEKADQLFGQIREFAVNTPMQLKDLASGAQTLLSFNYEADKVMTTLKALGDISMGDSQRFQSLTLAFAQMSSTGKLMGQDLLQMINAGFNPLSVIAEQTGKSIGDLKEEMSKGAISAEMIEKAFIAAASAGGKFHGMLAAQSKSIGGAISNLQGAVDDMLNELGEGSQGVVTDAVELLTHLAKNYKEVGEAVAVLIGIYGTYKAAIAATTIVTRALQMAEVQKNLAAKEGITISTMQALRYMFQAKATDTATAATGRLNATMLANPYALVAAAVAALAYGIYKLVTYETDAEKATKDLKKATEECDAAIASEQANIDILFGTLKGATKGTKDYENAKQAILDQYGKYLKGLSDEIATLKDVEAAYIAVKIAAEQAAKARAIEAYTKKATETYGAKYGEEATEIRDALIGKYGNKAGAEYYIKLKPVIEGKKQVSQLDAQMQRIVKSFDELRFVYMGQYAPAYTYTTNVITEGISNITRARTVLNDTIKEAQDIFGNQGIEEEKNEVAPVIKNKKYWEEQKKQLEGQLEAMADTEMKSKKAIELRQKIAKAQQKIDSFSTSKYQKAQERQTKKENRQRVQLAGLDEKSDEFDQRQIVAARQFALDVRQAEVDGMQEGFDKVLAQNKLNYDKLLEQNIQRREQFVEQLRDMAELEWEKANPNAKDEGRAFDRKSVSAEILNEGFDISNLPVEQQAIINSMRAQLVEYARIAGVLYQKANKDSLDTMLSDVLTYEEQRKKITEDYAKRREELYDHDKGGRTGLRTGVSEGNVAELGRQEQEALNAIDEQFASREVQYQAWCDAIGELSLKQLEDLLAKAQQELDALEANGGDSTQLATARAKVNKLDDAVKKQKATDELAPKKRTIKEWQDLYSTLNECAGAFDDIGEAVGGTTGEILKAAGQIATSTLSMINGIVTLANSSGTAMAGTASAASTAISTVEKASVILTVISAALQVATAIANLFNDDDKKQEEIEHLQERIDQLQWELDNRDVLRINNEYGTSLERVRQSIYDTRMEIIAAAQATGNWGQVWRAAFGKISKDAIALEKTVEKLASAYEKMSYTSGKALGENHYSDYYEQLKNISEQQILIQEQIANEKSKKKTDWGQISEWEQKIEELGAQAKTIIDDMMEDIIGGSAEEIAEELSDAFFEAFANGEDAAEAWGDKVKEITADIVKKMLVQQMLEGEIGKLFDKYKAQWFKNGQFVGTEGVKDSMSNFMNDLFAVESTMEQVWAAIPDELKEFLTGDAEREGVSKGIATASQDSVDELNARATTIQSHTFSISENTKLLVANTTAILGSVQAIEHHTEAINNHMETIETGVKNLRNTLDDIQIQGIKLK